MVKLSDDVLHEYHFDLIEEKVRTRKVENDDDTSVVELADEEDDHTETVDLRKVRSTRNRRASETTPYCRKCELDVSDAPSIVCPKCGFTPLCGDHFNDDQGVCALCTPSVFSETTTADLPTKPTPIVESVLPAPKPGAEHAVHSRAPVEFTRPKLDHRTVHLDDIIEVATAKKWADEIVAAIDVVVKYGGILVRVPFTRSTNDLDFLVQHLVLVGVSKRKATPMAEKIIAEFERDVAIWRSGGSAPRLMFDLSESVMNERFRSHPTTKNELYPLLLRASAHVLDAISHDPPRFSACSWWTARTRTPRGRTNCRSRPACSRPARSSSSTSGRRSPTTSRTGLHRESCGLSSSPLTAFSG